MCSIKKLDVCVKQEPEYYNGDPSLPILERIAPNRKRLYSVEDIARLLLHPMLKSSKLTCTKVPASICGNVSLVVNLDGLDNPDDVLSDDMGVWRNNGVITDRVLVKFAANEVQQVEKCSPAGAPSASSYSVKRVYRTHGTDSSLKKLTAYVYGMYIHTLLVQSSRWHGIGGRGLHNGCPGCHWT